MQPNEPGLFDLEDEAAPQAFEEPAITDQQIASIRQAFEEAGITSMEQRQQLIESCVVRPVARLRELQARDVRRILQRISDQQQSKGPVTGSAWDNRDEDTWIDKL
ncbi:hypothetical protein MUG94_03235 [Arthrobacter gengyunqii]|uniref:Uncharacterized protein n=1 Tax=Arthrobacter gengyunqii TaxID=2886940 RepID=A0A9X1M3A4_9MICC|nr:hypothetical protein [Arthrobacter gengyunqii]MCC3270095.1 hypothetical protein [Arthrobacter gengyunqii]UOY96803.1 hypothetical protein MUG94_03235 [Arthrobacter gengyunqii]